MYRLKGGAMKISGAWMNDRELNYFFILMMMMMMISDGI